MVLGVHAAPGRDDGHGFRPGLDEAELISLLGDCDVDLLCVGHTHQSMNVVIRGTRILNVGSVSNPVLPDLRAEYVILEARATGYHVEQRRVEYDRKAVITALECLRHPGAEFIVRHMRGLCRPP
jgi:predicted phosphodiesterase